MPETPATELVLTRKELYERVWQTPMRTLAPQLGLSDVGLAKLCRKASVPVPPVGYWAKLQHGKRVRRPGLPQVTDEIAWMRFDTTPRPPRAPRVEPTLADPALAAALERFKAEPDLVVPRSIGAMHPITQAMSDAIARAVKAGNIASNGIVDPDWRARDARMSIEIGAAAADRVARIVDGIVRGAESLGVLRTARLDGKALFRVGLEDRDFGLSITERCRQRPYVPKPRELYARKYEMHPCGELTVSLLDKADRAMESWRDTPRTPVEARLARFFDALPWSVQRSREAEEAARIAELKRIEDERRAAIEREEAHRRALEASILAAKERRRHEAEMAALRQLHEQAEAWEAADRIRRFAWSMEERALRANVPADEVKAWLDTVLEVAEELDPQRTFPPSPPERDALAAVRPVDNRQFRHW